MPLRRRCPPGTDETAMDFRRILPEIRWQSRLSPVSGIGFPDWIFEGDETAMDFRRILPEIRWQSRLSPVSGIGSPDWIFEGVIPGPGCFHPRAVRLHHRFQQLALFQMMRPGGELCGVR